MNEQSLSRQGQGLYPCGRRVHGEVAKIHDLTDDLNSLGKRLIDDYGFVRPPTPDDAYRYWLHDKGYIDIGIHYEPDASGLGIGLRALWVFTQGQGNGRAILAAVLKAADQLGISRLYLCPRPFELDEQGEPILDIVREFAMDETQLKAWYKRLGFWACPSSRMMIRHRDKRKLVRKKIAKRSA